MNAYELAKDLNIKASMINLGEKIAWGSDSGIMDEAANMLRQQADELKQWKLLHNDCMEMIEQRDARIKELEKQRNRLEILAEQMLRDGDDE
jgi:sensor histidine kinase YesM